MSNWSTSQHQELVAALQAGLEQVQARLTAACNAAGRSVDEVRLLPVSKTLPVASGPALLAATQACGLSSIAENRIDHCADLLAAAPELSVEHIGRLQSRQLAKLPPQVTAVHALAAAKHVEKISFRRGRTAAEFFGLCAG